MALSVSEPTERQIECLNEAAAVCLAGSMVLHTVANPPSGPPGEKVLRTLHQVLTFLILERPGQYRDSPTYIFETNEGTRLTTIVRHLPPPEAIEGLMARFFDELAVMWPSAGALDVAAFALWRILWVHPFKDFNGRAARAFAYICLCLKTGRLLPSPETFFNAALWQEGFVACVQESHATFEAGALDLSRMRSFLDALVKFQAHTAQREVAA